MIRTLLIGLAMACSVPENPPVLREIAWIDPETEALARRACYDCHANETVWKGVHKVPGINGWVEGHVEEGRCHMNFSAWDGPNEAAWGAVEELLEGEMPLPSYRRAHKEARLTDAEIARLAEGLEATFELDPPQPGEACEDDD